MTLVALSAVVAIVVSGPTLAATTFDLKCSIHETVTLPNRPDATEDYSIRLSIDLDAARWCSRLGDVSCGRIEKIAQISDDEIRLVDLNSALLMSVKSINRNTWAWSNHTVLKMPFISTTDETGSCVIMPFTPLPASNG
jgi:hypothetical protein